MKVPQAIREWVPKRPEVFGKLARLDGETLDLLLAQIDETGVERKARRKSAGGLRASATQPPKPR